MYHFFSIIEIAAAFFSLLAIPIGVYASIYSAELKARITQTRLRVLNRRLRKDGGRVLLMDYFHLNPSAMLGRAGVLFLLVIGQLTSLLLAILLEASFVLVKIAYLEPERIVNQDKLHLFNSTLHIATPVLIVGSIISAIFLEWSLFKAIFFCDVQAEYEQRREAMITKMIRRMVEAGSSKEEAEALLLEVFGRR